MKSHGGSSGQPRPGEGLGPFLAIAQADLRSLFTSRLTYGWLLAAVFVQVVRTLGSGSTGTTSSVVPSGLSDFVYLWSLVMIGLAASSVTSESGELADSILSKSVTRLDYVLAKFASRVVYTLACFSLVTVVLVGLSLKLDANDYAAAGLLSAILLVALTLVALTSIGVGLSVVMPSTVTAMVTLLVLWYSMTFFFPVLGLSSISPGSVISGLPDIVKGAWSWGDWGTVASFAAVSGAAAALASAYFCIKDI
jgi:ABC-2 type transport system permease protein